MGKKVLQNKMAQKEQSKTAIFFAFMFGIIGLVPLYAIIFIFQTRLYFLCLFIGFGFSFGYYLIKKEEIEIKQEVLLIFSTAIITILTAICADCIYAYQTYIIQCDYSGIDITYSELFEDVPLSHLLGNYLGLDLFETGNKTIVLNTLKELWMNIVQSLIFSLIGTQIIKIYLYFDKKFEHKFVRTKNNK